MEQFSEAWRSMQPTWNWGKVSGEKKEDEFRLPIKHKISENLDRDNLEQASMDKEIPPSNVGFQLLQKMGWRQGQGLGRSRQGIVDPVRSAMNEFRLGLGKQAQDDFYTNEENIQRKKLEIEIEETEEIAQKREEVAQKIEKIQAEVKEIRKVFYCELCNKQYKLAAEFEVHLSSYDHNHKKRFKESVRSLSDKEKEERLRRESLREQKELEKRAQLLASQKAAASGQAVPSEPLPNSGATAVSVAPTGAATAAPIPAVRQGGALKFGLGGKGKSASGSKATFGRSKGKSAPVASIFGSADDEDEDP